MNGDRVRAVQERRRAHAAGPHDQRRTRAAELADALALQDQPGDDWEAELRARAADTGPDEDDHGAGRLADVIRELRHRLPDHCVAILEDVLDEHGVEVGE